MYIQLLSAIRKFFGTNTNYRLSDSYMSAKFLGDQVGFVESKVLIYKSRDELFLLVQPTIHSDSDCWISFGNWFWHLIVGNRSIVLNFYQQRPVFALKNHPRPQRPKRPMKANKGQHSPKLQISLLLSLFNVKSSTNVNTILKKCVFKKLEIFIFIT